jgi:long-chain acyl-CoA synthetase
MFSQIFRENGLGSGACIVIHTANEAAAAAAIRQALASQTIPCVLDRRMPPAAVGALTARLSPAAVLTDPGADVHLRPFFSPATWLIAERDGTVHRMPGSSPAARRELEPDTACVFCTSGSTGDRRAIIVSRDNQRFSLAAIQRRLRYRPHDVVGIFVPLSFDYGFYQVLLADLVGARLVFGGGSFAGPDLVEKLRAGKVSVLPAVPGLIHALLKLLRRRPVQLPHLRMITSTGERLPPAWIDELRSFLPEVAVYPMYGLTECKRVSILLPEELDRRPGSVGRPLDGTVVHVLDEEERSLPAGAVGQLVVTGPHVTRGYLDAPIDTARTFRPWGPAGERALFSGDFGYLDPDGYLYLAGRRDSLIKRNGLRMSTVEVEQAAMSLPGVDAAILLHDQSTERLSLAVCAGPTVTAAALLGHLSTTLEPYKLPSQVRVLSELPRTANGKVDRPALEREFRRS